MDVCNNDIDSVSILRAGTQPRSFGLETPALVCMGDDLMRVAFEIFRGVLKTWLELNTQAAAFATQVGPERVINISQSCDSVEGIVTVWYWTD